MGQDAVGPFVLDSGCGTGQSTRQLAKIHPGAMVIGVDRSAARLARGVGPDLPYREENCIWVRAELASFWRLALEAGWRPVHHYLLYPNPWPKPGHLSRRWHGHPVFPALLALGGEIEMRCNWLIYAKEFAAAVGLATGESPAFETLRAASSISPFERKYRSSGHTLYRVRFRAKKSPGCPGL